MSEPARLDEGDDVEALLLELARAYQVILRLVRDIKDPALKAEIAALIWPPHPTNGDHPHD